MMISSHLELPTDESWCLLTSTAITHSTIAIYDFCLILEAKNIPYILDNEENTLCLKVPHKFLLSASHEIEEFASESQLPLIYIPAHRSVLPLFFVILSLIVLHAVRNSWFGLSIAPHLLLHSSYWFASFGLDSQRLIQLGEWWRTVTALMVHHTDAHLVSNIVFGTLFIGLVCIRVGSGVALISLLAGSVIANYCNAFLRQVEFISVGFSTTVFVGIGILATTSGLDFLFFKEKTKRSIRTFILPIASGIALLALLGGSPEKNTDVFGHLFGFFSGLGIGAIAWLVEKQLRRTSEQLQKNTQLFLGILASIFVLFCWIQAIRAL